MSEYGYGRISTPKQNIDRQVRNIRAAYPDAVVLTETYTGTKINRKEWRKLMSAIQPNDTIVFDSVSRMSRNAEEGFETYQELFDKGVALVFLKEPHINTEVYKRAFTAADELPATGNFIADVYMEATKRVMMHLAREQIKIAFEQAEKEVSDLHQRTKEGIQTARLNGKQIGQAQGVKLITKKSREAKEQILRHSKAFNGTLNDADVIKLTGLARNTYYKYKRELSNDCK